MTLLAGVYFGHPASSCANKKEQCRLTDTRSDHSSSWPFTFQKVQNTRPLDRQCPSVFHIRYTRPLDSQCPSVSHIRCSIQDIWPWYFLKVGIARSNVILIQKRMHPTNQPAPSNIINIVTYLHNLPTQLLLRGHLVTLTLQFHFSY